MTTSINMLLLFLEDVTFVPPPPSGQLRITDENIQRITDDNIQRITDS